MLALNQSTWRKPGDTFTALESVRSRPRCATQVVSLVSRDMWGGHAPWRAVPWTV